MATPKEEKILKAINLSPGIHPIEKLLDAHPMKQVIYASIIQVLVVGFMFGCMAIINLLV